MRWQQFRPRRDQRTGKRKTPEEIKIGKKHGPEAVVFYQGRRETQGTADFL
jgi:hypothetical protein